MSSPGIEELMRVSRSGSVVAGDQAARLRAMIDAVETPARTSVYEANPDQRTDEGAKGQRHANISSGAPCELKEIDERLPSCTAGNRVKIGESENIHKHIGQVNQTQKTVGETGGGAVLVTVASGKGGVGKTSLAVNLAIATTKLGCRTMLLDADLGTANADVLCGVMPSARLDHVITPLPVHDGSRRTLAEIAIDTPGGFRLIPGASGVGRMANLAGPQRRQLIESMSELESQCDLIIIDAAAGVSSLVTSFIEASDRTLVVTTPEPTAVTDAYSLLKCVVSERLNNGLVGHAGASDIAAGLGLVINQVVDQAEARAVYQRIAAVCDRFLGAQIPMRGWVAQDVRVSQAVRSKQPLMLVSPNAGAASNISAIACSLVQDLALEPRCRVAQRQPGRLARAMWRLVGRKT